MEKELDPEFIENLQWHANHHVWVETHHRLVCPNCYDGCHSLYVIGKCPDDYLGCRTCCKNAEIVNKP